MSVDVTARIGYGFMVPVDEHIEYINKIENIDDPNFMTLEDNYIYINSYADDSDVFYGLRLEATDYWDSIDSDLNSLIDDTAWKEFFKLFEKEFPDIAKNENPQFYLICQWW